MEALDFLKSRQSTKAQREEVCSGPQDWKMLAKANMAMGQKLRYLFGVGKATPRSSLFLRLFGCSLGYRGFDPLPCSILFWSSKANPGFVLVFSDSFFGVWGSRRVFERERNLCAEQMFTFPIWGF